MSGTGSEFQITKTKSIIKLRFGYYNRFIADLNINFNISKSKEETRQIETYSDPEFIMF